MGVEEEVAEQREAHLLGQLVPLGDAADEVGRLGYAHAELQHRVAERTGLCGACKRGRRGMSVCGVKMYCVGLAAVMYGIRS